MLENTASQVLKCGLQRHTFTIVSCFHETLKDRKWKTNEFTSDETEEMEDDKKC